MKTMILACFLAASLFPAMKASAQTPCVLRPVAFHPLKVLGEYLGRGTSTEIGLAAEKPVGVLPLFNDALTVTRKGSEKSCRLGEGIWEIGRIYLSADESTLAAVESSGSSSSLSFFDLSSCKKVASIEVAGLKYEIVKGRVSYQGVCEYTSEDKNRGSCSPAAVYDLPQDCHPRMLERESLALTKKIFGVAFSKLSDLEFPHTPKARVIP